MWSQCINVTLDEQMNRQIDIAIYGNTALYMLVCMHRVIKN